MSTARARVCMFMRARVRVLFSVLLPFGMETDALSSRFPQSSRHACLLGCLPVEHMIGLDMPLECSYYPLVLDFDTRVVHGSIRPGPHFGAASPSSL